MLTLARLLERLSLGTGVIAALLIAPLLTASTIEVFSRYALGQPTIWAYEVGYMGLGAYFLLGGAYTLKIKGHIRIDIVYAHLPAKVRAAIDLVNYAVIMLPFCLWLSWALWDFFYDAWIWGETSGQSAWNPVVWPFRLVMVTSFVVLAIQLVAESLKCLSVLVGHSRSLEEIG
ncbi:MAG: TRAP transporter small permease subunit [Kiloniellales bacterium]